MSIRQADAEESKVSGGTWRKSAVFASFSWVLTPRA